MIKLLIKLLLIILVFNLNVVLAQIDIHETKTVIKIVPCEVIGGIDEKVGAMIDTIISRLFRNEASFDVTLMDQNFEISLDRLDKQEYRKSMLKKADADYVVCGEVDRRENIVSLTIKIFDLEDVVDFKSRSRWRKDVEKLVRKIMKNKEMAMNLKDWLELRENEYEKKRMNRKIERIEPVLNNMQTDPWEKNDTNRATFAKPDSLLNDELQSKKEKIIKIPEKRNNSQDLQRTSHNKKKESKEKLPVEGVQIQKKFDNMKVDKVDKLDSSRNLETKNKEEDQRANSLSLKWVLILVGGGVILLVIIKLFFIKRKVIYISINPNQLQQFLIAPNSFVEDSDIEQIEKKKIDVKLKIIGIEDLKEISLEDFREKLEDIANKNNIKLDFDPHVDNVFKRESKINIRLGLFSIFLGYILSGISAKDDSERKTIRIGGVKENEHIRIYLECNDIKQEKIDKLKKEMIFLQSFTQYGLEFSVKSKGDISIKIIQ